MKRFFKYHRNKSTSFLNKFPIGSISLFSPLLFTSLTVLVFLFPSCQPNKPETLFNLLTPEQTGVNFVNLLEEDDSFNIIQYLYFYNGGGVAVGDLNNDGYPDIYLSSNRKSNRLYLNKSRSAEKIKFIDVTDAAGVAGTGSWTTGVNLVDINSDGWLDIYVSEVGGYKNFQGRNQLFINQGCTPGGDGSCQVTFKEAAAEYGLDFSGFSSQSAFFDYDLDGDLDMYLLCHSVHSSESYRDTASTRKRNLEIGDKLFENRGPQNNGNLPIFQDISERAGIYGGIAGYGLGISIGDLDKNGYPDIYIGNDFHENDFLYLNQGDGSFREASNRMLQHTSYFSMGNDMGDLNNDGWLDLMTLDMKPEDEVLFKSAQGPDPYDIYRFKRSFGYHHQFPQNSLHINLGANVGEEIRFSENAQIMGVSSTDWSWSTLLADFDLDGWKDIYISNGIPKRPNNLDYLKFISNRKIQEKASDLELTSQMPSGKVSNYAYHNLQGSHFEDQTEAWGVKRPSISHGAAYADFDQDGDLDLVVNNLNDAAYLYENTATQITGNHFITIKLKGPPENTFAIGSKVTVKTGDRVQYQELFVTRGWQSTVDYALSFGVDKLEVIDTIRVEWPDRKIQIVTGVDADQIITIDYKNAFKKSNRDQERKQNYIFAKSEITPDFSHTENAFFDNTREPLIPYLLSTQGPRISIADVNGDHRQDFYVGGASGQTGALFQQNVDGHFEATNEACFLPKSGCEDTGVTFFDADQDGDPDLYIGSGGNQYHKDEDKLRDRLYFNDGRGNFSYSPEALPDILEQTSCVKAYDFDGDGDTDLFVGTRSIALSYGRPADSYLLVNDGMGRFQVAGKDLIDLTGLGMVTDAEWCDVDNNGKIDLLVVGDWMPVTIFTNDGIGFTPGTTGAATYGWWNTIAVSDLNQDGLPDLVLGNLGSNSNLQASAEMPVQLYLADFDANLTQDPIITYFKQGREYPLLGLDMLGSQMVFLKKKFRSYDQFATKTIDDILNPDQLQASQISKVTTLTSMYAINNGQGEFTFIDLPLPVQNSSINAILIYDFNADQYPDILMGGNFYDLQPAIGRMDSNYGNLLINDRSGKFVAVKNSECNLLLEGQIKDLKIIETGSKKTILVARNNAPLQCLEISEGI
ncbi:MAG: VCBS repeat-containing protein [Saprospiraceae bacterium]|nr:VCBS repeat-containing protein [Saprospiraceae bacterium]